MTQNECKKCAIAEWEQCRKLSLKLFEEYGTNLPCGDYVECKPCFHPNYSFEEP